MAKKATPAAASLLQQATTIWPKRKRASDGLLPSAAHLKASPDSDHNTGHAVDLTHDPKNGVDCAVIFEQLKKDKRVKYLIFNKRIWVRGQREKDYSGPNPHTSHLHVSILDAYGDNDSAWFAWALQPAPKPKPSISNILTRRLKPVCTCKPCPVHTKGKDEKSAKKTAKA